MEAKIGIPSNPSRVRGLKHHVEHGGQDRDSVAPLTGAWIETRLGRVNVTRISVAPLTGAWIETIEAFSLALPEKSHPSRVRGLKHCFIALAAKRDRSHPSRVRGLKLDIIDDSGRVDGSHPSRVRGLKPQGSTGHKSDGESHPSRVRGLKL